MNNGASLLVLMIGAFLCVLSTKSHCFAQAMPRPGMSHDFGEDAQAAGYEVSSLGPGALSKKGEPLLSVTEKRASGSPGTRYVVYNLLDGTSEVMSREQQLSFFEELSSTYKDPLKSEINVPLPGGNRIVHRDVMAGKCYGSINNSYDLMDANGKPLFSFYPVIRKPKTVREDNDGDCGTAHPEISVENPPLTFLPTAGGEVFVWSKQGSSVVTTDPDFKTYPVNSSLRIIDASKVSRGPWTSNETLQIELSKLAR